MRSTALPSRRPGTASRAAAVAVVAAVLGAGASRAQDTPVPAAPEGVAGASQATVERGVNPFADRFPNVVLRTHEGRNVRFYDDLLQGKIVLLNFMYATCTKR